MYCMTGHWSSGVVATKKVLRSTPQENSVLFLDLSNILNQPSWWGDSPRVKKLLQTNKMNISNKTCRTKSLKRLVINVWILPNFYSWLQRNMIISPMCPVPVLCVGRVSWWRQSIRSGKLSPKFSCFISSHCWYFYTTMANITVPPLNTF